MPHREQNDRGTGAQLRADLVAAASELLLSPQALAAPSLRAVARACAVSPAAVYLHFESQQVLISAVVDGQLDELRSFIHSAIGQETDPTRRLERFCLAYSEWGVTRPGGYQLLFETADRPGMPVSHALGQADQDDPDDQDDERWDLLTEAGELLAAATSATPTDDGHERTLALWAALHGIVSLRIHKLDIAWPSSRDTDVLRALARHLRG